MKQIFSCGPYFMSLKKEEFVNKAYVLIVTVKTYEEAKKISQDILCKRLCACVQIEPINSLYIWNSVLEDETEYRISIKTFINKTQEISDRIKNIHSYTTPQILGYEIEIFNEKYYKWMCEAINK
ncbi:Divalent-cation tolerance protein CutA [Astathelohania contejeani]|uniref:Divalent-cation tolerance protein CutA n=1 Tax=Astathelohania contejeani TaxID=164912 RepID=A0ABQ7HWT3_9MICR|nr:Divalent-cation tolerance protein CutA [Thelohania contejeani]